MDYWKLYVHILWSFKNQIEHHIIYGYTCIVHKTKGVARRITKGHKDAKFAG